MERGQIADVAKTVRELEQVEEGALLIGRFDLLVKVTHFDRSDLYRTVSKIRALPGIRATSTHIPFESFAKDYIVKENDALAVSLLRTESSNSTILMQLRNLRHVVEGHIIPGDWDLLVILHSNRVEEILETAVNQFEAIQGISKTETMLAHQYFRKNQEITTSVGTFIPQYAFDRLKDKTSLGMQQGPA
jgi:DNA-binding Lrp family transcriptional regulator